MAKTGANFEPCNVGSVEKHNKRDADYLESVKESGRSLYFFQDLTANNSSWVNPDYQGKTCEEIFDELKKLYTEKTGQAPQLKDRVRVNKKTGREYTVAGWSPIREAVIPIKADTTVDDFKPVIDWLKTKGWNVIRLDLHKDEGYKNEVTGERKMNYHAHLVVDCLDHQTGRTVKLSKNDMSLKGIQGIVADALGMERGIPKAITGAEHRDQWQQREYAAAKNYRRLEIKVKGLSKMVENLTNNRTEILQEMEQIHKQAEEGKISQYVLQQNIGELQAKLEDVENKLKDKTEKLEKAMQQLSEFTERKLKAERDYYAIMRKTNTLKSELNDLALVLQSSTAWDIAVEGIKDIKDKLDSFMDELTADQEYKLRTIIDDSIIDDMAQRGNEIVGVAAALSLGYVEQAMTFAQSHGGGGGSAPQSGWGQQPGEDDDSWRRRCFHMAKAMMRPAKGRTVNQSRWHR